MTVTLLVSQKQYPVCFIQITDVPCRSSISKRSPDQPRPPPSLSGCLSGQITHIPTACIKDCCQNQVQKQFNQQTSWLILGCRCPNSPVLGSRTVLLSRRILCSCMGPLITRKVGRQSAERNNANRFWNHRPNPTPMASCSVSHRSACRQTY